MSTADHGSDTRQTLSRKVSVSLIKIVLLFTVIAIFLFSSMLYLKLSGQLKEKADRLTNLTALSIAQPLWDFDLTATEEIIKAVKLDQEIVYILITNEKEEKVLELGQPDPDSLFQFEQDILTKEKQKIGKTLIVFTTQSLWLEIITNSLLIMLAIISLFLILLILIRKIFDRQVHDPLEMLMGHAQEIGKGNLEARIDLQTEDEFAKLGATFNQMVSELGDYQKPLL